METSSLMGTGEMQRGDWRQLDPEALRSSMASFQGGPLGRWDLLESKNMAPDRMLGTNYEQTYSRN